MQKRKFRTKYLLLIPLIISALVFVSVASFMVPIALAGAPAGASQEIGE